jgi:hypothetical protein
MTISATDILSLTAKVTKEWTKQRKAEERNRRSRDSRPYVYSNRVTFTDVAHAIIPGAYQHASGNGKHTVPKRQIYYACREQFREKTGREITAKYFVNTVLVQYMNRHPETESWKVTADPRGTLTIPNADHKVQIPCGTLQIQEHLAKAGADVETFDIDAKLPIEWPSLAGGQRYRAVLYIEKEGFDPMLKEAKIAERFEVAILSCKGMSVVAARRFVDEVCAQGNGVPLLIVHDFDKSGFEISQSLTRVSEAAREKDRVTYEFQNDIDFTDLGLRLADVRKYGLAEERFRFRGDFADDSIATPEEQEFLRSGRRVELNAFTAPEFIEWLEGKLTEHLGKKRFVPNDDVLGDAYRRALVVAEINQKIEDAIPDAIDKARAAKLPKTLRRQLAKQLANRKEPWDQALYSLAKKQAYSDDED